VLWGGYDFSHGAVLYYFSPLHDDDAVGNAFYSQQVQASEHNTYIVSVWLQII